MSRLILLALVLAPPPQPKTPVREVKDSYFGTTVSDPYRWLEDEKSPEVAAWLKAQNDHTRAVLAALPGRDAFLARIHELNDADVKVGAVTHWGGRWFYYKVSPGKDNRSLCTRDSLRGAERVLVDPEKLGDKEHHFSIDYYLPSLDGKRVAYGISPGGSEDSVMHILDARTGKALPDVIDRTRWGMMAWLPDNKSFVYARLQKVPAGAPAADNFKKMRVYLHVLGRSPDDDPPVFGWDVSPRAPMGEADFPSLWYSPASPWVIASLSSGTTPERVLYAAPVSALAKPDIPWNKLADTSAAIVGWDARGDDLYLLTHKDALRYKVTHVDLKHPDLAAADVVVPPSNAVVTDLGVAKDGLYVSKREGAVTRLERLAWKGHTLGPAEHVTLPVEGTIGFWTHGQQDGTLVFATSWTHAPAWYQYDPRTRKAADMGLLPPSKADFSQIDAEEVIVPSTQQAQVPLSILHRKDLPLDGSHPTLLVGYGAYGSTSEPFFDATRLAWLEKGGVLAVAHVRGGGEYGEEWHLAGQKANKQHTVDDFIASAMYLVHGKYTSPDHLAGEGTSAGGLLIGGAITQHPELFGAAVDRVGCADMLRFEITQGGPANTHEFGTIKKKEEVPWLIAMSPYHHVKKGTRYPAVLLTTGMFDPRVPVWQPAKMAARLQAANAGTKPILLRVEYDAGHGLGSTKSQHELELADELAFLWWQLAGTDASAAGGKK